MKGDVCERMTGQACELVYSPFQLVPFPTTTTFIGAPSQCSDSQISAAFQYKAYKALLCSGGQLSFSRGC